MATLTDFVTDLPGYLRVLALLVIAFGAHLVVRAIRFGVQRLVRPGEEALAAGYRSTPKVQTVTKLVASGLTFVIYFLAVGFIFQQAGVPLGTYLATATVIGLAVGFGSQGIVQDVVIGLTLVFSDVVDVGDVVDIGGQTGRVDRVGLRFTTLTNVHEQKIFVPNRTIGLINRYRNGYIRAYVDVQVPEETAAETVRETVRPIAQGLRDQHREIVLRAPEIMGVREVDSGGWSYLRVKFRIWPGQNALIETNFRQRVLAAMRGLDEDYADWMVTVTYRAE